MGSNKLLINGQLFIGRAEIESFSTQQQSGGIEVDWGNGDIDILEGETSNTSSASIYGWFGFARYRPSFAGCVYQSIIVAFKERRAVEIIWSASDPNNYPDFPPVPPFGVSGAAGDEGTPSVTFRDGPLDRCGDQLVRYWVLAPGVNGRYIWGPSDIPQSLGAGFIYFQRHPSGSIRWEVITNTGDSSARIQANSPIVSLQGDDCALIITYQDGKTQTLTYPECPTVAPYEEPDCPLPCALANQVIASLRG